MRNVISYTALIAVLLVAAFMGCNQPEFAFDALASIVTTPDGTDFLALREGNVNKRITASNFRTYVRPTAAEAVPLVTDFVYTADTITLDSSRNLTVFANSATGVVQVTIPTAPTFEQQILFLADYTASNQIYLIGGVVDSFTADGAKMLVYDLGNTTWRKLTLE